MLAPSGRWLDENRLRSLAQQQRAETELEVNRVGYRSLILLQARPCRELSNGRPSSLYIAQRPPQVCLAARPDLKSSTPALVEAVRGKALAV